MNRNHTTRSKGMVHSAKNTRKWPSLEEAKAFRVKVNRNLNPRPFLTTGDTSASKTVANNGFNNLIKFGQLRKEGILLGRQLQVAFNKGNIEEIDRISEEGTIKLQEMHHQVKKMMLPANTIDERETNVIKMNFRGGKSRTRRRNRTNHK
jgi:hypothetical protein